MMKKKDGYTEIMFLKSVKKRKQGFTIIEMLLAVAIIVGLAGLSAPLYQSFQNQTDLNVAIQSQVQALRSGQSKARSGRFDEVWGVHASTSAITIFRGSDFSSRDTSFDEVFTISSSLTITGLAEVVFVKRTGVPNTVGTTTFTTVNNVSKDVGINEQGVITVQ